MNTSRSVSKPNTEESKQRVEEEKQSYRQPQLKKHGKLKSTATQTTTYVYTYTYIT